MGKRLLYLAVLVMAAMVVFAPAAMAQDKLNCVEVSTGDAETIQEEAQALLNENPNGPARNLDADGDGIACEYTISAQSGTQFEDGSGFISGAQAAPSDAPAQSGVQGQYQTPSGAEVAPVTPPPGADSPVFQPTEPDVAVLPDTGGPVLLLPLGVLLVGSGALGFVALSRRV